MYIIIYAAYYYFIIFVLKTNKMSQIYKERALSAPIQTREGRCPFLILSVSTIHVSMEQQFWRETGEYSIACHYKRFIGSVKNRTSHQRLDVLPTSTNGGI